MNSGLISIIVPVFNCSEYISECIDSILTQTYINFELLLLNDGSTDGSKEICLEYEKLDSRVKVFSHSNIGVSRTRKRGLNLAKGMYVTFIDSDDSIKNNYLATLYNKMLNDKLDIVCCNSIDSGEENESILEDAIINEDETWLNAFFDGKRYAYCIWGKLYKKQILEDIKFPDMKYGEDTFIVLTAFKNCKKIGVIRYAGYLYRDNPTGAMRNASGLQQPKDVLKLIKYVYEICINDYATFEPCALKKLIKTIFSVIIEGASASKEEWIGAKMYVDSCIVDIPKKRFLNSLKGNIVLLYSFMPKFVCGGLRLYRMIKYRRVY